MIYLSTDGCEANGISFLLPYNNKLHVQTPVESPQHMLGFNRSYSKIDNLNLMQILNLTSLTDDKLQDLAHKILEMKQMSFYSIHSALTKLRRYLANFWSLVNVKAFPTIGSLTTALALAISLYCKCFWNKMGCVCEHTRPATLPKNDQHIEL